MSKRLTESQIVSILKEDEAGVLIPALCRKHSIGQSIFYKWRFKIAKALLGTELLGLRLFPHNKW